MKTAAIALRALRRLGPARCDRGSVLITALLFSAIIAISLTTYIKLAINSLSLAERSFYQNAGVNLCEVGIEEAIYCYNRLDNATVASDAWSTSSGWSSPAGDRSVTRTISSVELGTGVSGQIKIYCSDYNPTGTTNPTVVAKSIVTFARGGATIEKYMQVTLRRRSLFANGLVARDSMTWSGGNVFVDSWRSDPDNDSSTAAEAYSTSVQRANGTVGTLNTANGAINIGNGKVYGYVYTAGGSLSYGPNAVVSGNFSSTTVDTSRISTDFSANFPTISIPTPSATNTISATINSTTTLPRTSGTDSRASDGYYYYTFNSGTELKLNGGGSNLQVTDKVVLIFNNHANDVPTLTIGGNSYISVAANAKMQVYSNGKVSIGGGGVANSNTQPSSFLIFGTASTSQTISISGNGSLVGAVYAPNGTVSMNGGGASGAVYGSVVARSISLTGGSAFHYDESMANVGTGNPFGIIEWRELRSTTERTTVATKLTF